MIDFKYKKIDPKDKFQWVDESDEIELLHTEMTDEELAKAVLQAEMVE